MSDPKNKSESQGVLGFLQNLFSSFLGGMDPDREKKKLLKDITKDLKKQGKYYKGKDDSVQPALAKFFYDIYKAVGPAQVLLERYVESDVLKQDFVETFMSAQEKQLVGQLSEENLRQRVQTVPLKQLKDMVKDEIVRVYSLFDINKVKQINALYISFLDFYELLSFDYYFLLKKFDAGMPDNDFVYNPRFEPINAEYIVEDLKDFLVVAMGIRLDADWDTMLDILQGFKQMELIPKATWKKVLQQLKDVLKSNLLNQLVMVGEENPYYKPVRERHSAEIVETYLSKLKNTAERTIGNIHSEKRTGQIEMLLKNIFGTTAISRTQYYTSKENLNFQKKNLTGYTHVEPINYLKAFYLDFYKSKVRQMVDVLLIQGQWATNVQSQSFSDTYHHLLKCSDEVVNFDKELAEDGATGVRIRRLFRAVTTQDRMAINGLQEAINQVNEEAREIIQVSASNFIALGKTFKQLIEDCKRMERGQIIINWRELDTRTDHHITAQMTAIYKNLYYLVQLLQYYTKEKNKT